MELVPTSKDAIAHSPRMTKNTAVIEAFLEMNVDVAEVKDYPCANAIAEYSSLTYTAKAHDYPVSVIRRKDKIFLLKEDK